MRSLNCAKDIPLEEFRKADSKMNRIVQEFRQEQEQLNPQKNVAQVLDSILQILHLTELFSC